MSNENLEDLDLDNLDSYDDYEAPKKAKRKQQEEDVDTLDDDFDPNNEYDPFAEDERPEDSEEVEAEAETDEESEEDEEEEQPKPKKNSRAQERIQELVAARNAERAESDRLKAEKEELLKQLKASKTKVKEYQKSTISTQKALLQNTIKNTKALLQKAHEEVDYAKIIELQEELTNANLRIVALDAYEPEDDEEEIEVKPEETKADISRAPKELQNWLGKNAWFLAPKTATDAAKIKVATGAYEMLVAQGVDPESKALYSKIDKILGVDNDEDDDVELHNDASSAKTLKPRKRIPQNFQGGSRSSKQTPQTPNKSNKKVTLTSEQRELAKLFGISEKEYAREMLKMEQAEKTGQKMVDIF